ncbi:phage holin family protein [Candidatus Neptunochlamydia vexilliferae]|uniref:phage holin family protein n=1 Tax=Candidatus Neptunichlamydia vexilliferae TaxID=1651774 RepID=UPI001890ED17|nr:phage holin family protein [Candidatus Neptunochlamydia vexilliferae]
MLLFIVRVIITTIVVLLCAHFLPGLEVKNNLDAIFFGLILAVINSVVRPILTLLTLPISILTLGLFLLVINSFTFWLASEISYGVHIHTFWGAFWGGAIIWATGIFTNRLIWDSHTY